MNASIQCIEPRGRPVSVVLEVEEGSTFGVWLLVDEGLAADQLRSTLLRAADELPPAGARMLLEIRLEAAGAGREDERLRVVRDNPDLPIDQVRVDHRARLVPGAGIRSAARLEMSLVDGRRVSFSLHAAGGTTDARPEQAVGGSGGGEDSQVLAATGGALWLVPSAWSVIADMPQWVINQIRALAVRLGFTPRSAAILIMVGMFLLGNAALFYSQYTQRLDAEETAATAESTAERAQAAAQAALLAEVTCLDERASLVEALGDRRERRRFKAEVALAASASRAAALEIGGARMGRETLLARDAAASRNLIGAVVAAMAEEAVAIDLERCLRQEQSLGYDLARYALAWHGERGQHCPFDYAAVDKGITRVGRWGLSPRAAREFGEALPETEEGGFVAELLSEVLTDPRAEDRWSARTHATGLRTIQSSLLESRAGGRVAVLPSQAQLWSLALWSGYNRMPSPAEGFLDEPATACVRTLLEDLAASSGAARPDEPILPSLELVASGAISVPVRPTAGCPWPADSLTEGASSAIEAVVVLARQAPLEGG